MNRYTFIKTRDVQNPYDITEINMTVETESLPELLEEFKNFLIASGFTIHGDIMIEEPEND